MLVLSNIVVFCLDHWLGDSLELKLFRSVPDSEHMKTQLVIFSDQVTWVSPQCEWNTTARWGLTVPILKQLFWDGRNCPADMPNPSH